jgi:HlyD family secretion protein
MNRRRNTIIAVAALAALLVIGFFVAAKSGGRPVAVRLVTVHFGTFTTKLPETGVIQRPRLITIPAGVGGNLGLIDVKAGDSVKAGQVLATIVNPGLVSNLHDAEDNMLSAQGHAASTAETNAVLPQQNHSQVVQAQASVVQARAGLQQARQDAQAGEQSGLGYPGATAEEQRLTADTTLRNAATEMREARRIYEANKYLFSQKGLSQDALDQSEAKYEQALATWQQASRERQILGGQLSREDQTLHDRVRAAEDALRQAEAQLAAAQADASETKTGDVEAAQADAARARSDLTFAQDQVDRLQIRAPFDGSIEAIATQPNDTLRPIQPGDAVSPGESLFTLTASDTFIVRTKVDEQDVAALSLGQRAKVSGEDFAGKTLTGRIVAISPIAQRSDDPANTSRQVLTTIALDRTLPFLRDGMTVDVDIITHEESHVLAVPVDAVRHDDKGESYVFVAHNKRAARVDVVLGAQNDTSVIVTRGLHDGDVLVADKSADVMPNALVTAAPTPSPGVSGSPGP